MLETLLNSQLLLDLGPQLVDNPVKNMMPHSTIGDTSSVLKVKENSWVEVQLPPLDLTFQANSPVGIPHTVTTLIQPPLSQPDVRENSLLRMVPLV
jgi:hypothetical protein